VKNPELDGIQYKKFPVLDDGHVVLVDCMGTDFDVCQAARVSYGNEDKYNEDFGEQIDEIYKSLMQFAGDATPASVRRKKELIEKREEIYEKLKSNYTANEKLIRYLMRHRHTTPFEMCELKFKVRVPMDCWRQWVRHRTFSINEYSTRYSEAIDSQQKTKSTEWRLQATDNKQGSSGYLEKFPQSYLDDEEMEYNPVHWDYTGARFADDFPMPSMDDAGAVLSDYEKDFHESARRVYQQRLAAGIAREQARKDLPLSTYTEAFWKGNLHNVLHFLSLRMDSHAQKEIREYANVIGNEIVSKLFPRTWEAFKDYRFNSININAAETEVFQEILERMAHVKIGIADVEELTKGKLSDREMKEFSEKLKRLGAFSV